MNLARLPVFDNFNSPVVSSTEVKLREEVFLYRYSSRPRSLAEQSWVWGVGITACYALKRAFDFTLALSLITVLAPFFLIIMGLIRLDSYGCVFYGEKRIGKDGELFRLYQFRIFHAPLPKYNFLRFFTEDDTDGERTWMHFQETHDFTSVGKWLHRLHLDKLPELFNILLGDMSMLGPRPRTVEEIRGYGISHLSQLHLKPGLAFLGEPTKPEDNAEVISKFRNKNQVVSLGWLEQIGALLKIGLLVFFGRAAY